MSDVGGVVLFRLWMSECRNEENEARGGWCVDISRCS